MSLLLDALNKADQERKRGDGPPSIDSHHDAAFRAQDHAKTPTLLIVLSVGVVLIILLLAVYWLGKNTQQPITPPTTSTPQTIVQKTETNATNSHQKDSAAEKDGSLEKKNLNQKNNYTANTTANNTNNIEATSEEQGVATLYHQQMTNNPTPTTTNSGAAPSATKDLTSPTSINQFANLPELHDLPNNILEKIPTLKYTEHNYNQNGGSVVINGTVKHINDQLSTGVVIDKILVDGMILHFENYSFKMRALNTWINM